MDQVQINQQLIEDIKNLILEIENKHAVLHEVDVLLNDGNPPALELIFSEPWAVSKLCLLLFPN